MVRFEDLKRGDKIARRIVNVDPETMAVTRTHGAVYTVFGFQGREDSASVQRSVWLEDEFKNDHFIHDLEFEDISVELNRWDKV